MNKERKSPRRYKTKGGVWKCRNTKAWYTAHESTYDLLEVKADDIPDLEEDNLLLSDGKVGYRIVLADNTFFTIPTIYDEIVCIGDNSNNELVLGVRIGSLWGIYTGKTLEVDCIYDAIGPIGPWGLCPVCQNGKWGVFEISGHATSKGKGEIVPCIYDGMDTDIFYDTGNFLVVLDDKRGLLDASGSVAIPILYDFCFLFDEYGVAEVEYNGKWGLINDESIEFVPCAYDEIWYKAGSKYIAGKRGNLWCIIGSDGKVITPFQYTKLLFIEKYGSDLLQAAIDKDNKLHLIEEIVKEYCKDE